MQMHVTYHPVLGTGCVACPRNNDGRHMYEYRGGGGLPVLRMSIRLYVCEVRVSYCLSHSSSHINLLYISGVLSSNEPTDTVQNTFNNPTHCAAAMIHCMIVNNFNETRPQLGVGRVGTCW
jgi:hypothetical protein